MEKETKGKASTKAVENPTATVEKTTTKKSKKDAEAKLDQTNEENLKKVAAKLSQGEVSLKKMKYIYPEDCLDPYARKKFRSEVRAALGKIEKKITKLTGSDDPRKDKKITKLQKELTELQKSYWTEA